MKTLLLTTIFVVSTLCSMVLGANPLEYYPLADGNYWEYDSNLGKFTMAITTTAKSGEYILITKVKGSTTKDYLQIKDDGIIVEKRTSKIPLKSEELTIYKPPVQRYKFPFSAGNKWQFKTVRIEGKENFDASYDISFENEEDITLFIDKKSMKKGEKPQTLKCIKMKMKIVSSDGLTQEIVQWFAKDVGLVKMDSKIIGKIPGLMGFASKLTGTDKINILLKSWNVNKSEIKPAEKPAEKAPEKK